MILYTTRYGGAGEIAKKIQKQLGEDCTCVNLMTEKVPSLDGCDTVVLGGSVYIGKVQKQLTAFIGKHLSQLLAKKIGLFLCAGAQKPEEREQQFTNAFPAELLGHAAAKDTLGYSYQFEKMKFMDKFIMKKIKGDAVSESHYDNENIRLFAESLKSAK